jgi:hypothetical protein
MREQHDEVPGEFHACLSYQQLNGCIRLPMALWRSSITDDRHGTMKPANNTFLALTM